MRVIELDPADTFASARDRLLRGGRERTVLVLPAGRDTLRRSVDLVLLRRLADHERLEVGIVTADRDVTRQARALGLPVFSSVTLAQHYRPGWWRGRRRAERVGFAPDDDRRSPEQIDLERAADPAAALGDRLWLAILIVAGLLSLALLLASTVYLLPHATVTLRPAALPVQIIAELAANPAADLPDAAGRVVPAQTARVPVTWEATVRGSGPVAESSVRALALQGLGAAAAEILTARLDPGQRLLPTSVRTAVQEEIYVPEGDATRLTLDAELEGLAIDTAHVVSAVYGELVAALPDGFTPDPATISLEIEPAVPPAADRFTITVRATGRGEINGPALADRLAAQPLDRAGDYLNRLALAEPATLDVQPGWYVRWFGRLPLRSQRIAVDVLP